MLSLCQEILTVMLKCIAISTPGARFSALAVKENFRDSIRKVAELGYDAVELHIRDPHAIDADEIESLLHQYRLPVPTIGTGQAYGEEGLSFADPDPAIRGKAVQRIRDQMDLASRLGIPQVTIGLIRGTVKPGADREQAEEYVRACMAECLDYNPAITLILEPLNRYETSLYNDTASAKEVIDRIGKPNLKMLIDTFHMNIEEPDIIAEHPSRPGLHLPCPFCRQQPVGARVRTHRFQRRSSVHCERSNTGGRSAPKFCRNPLRTSACG